MILIVCLDDKKQKMINHRRQSRDQAVTEEIQKICMGKKLWMSPYSDRLYGSLKGMELTVNPDFLSLAGSGEFCLAESEGLAAYEESIEPIIVGRDSLCMKVFSKVNLQAFYTICKGNSA